MNDVVLTLLTGRRPDLFARTVESALENAPGLLEESLVVVLVNGGDADSLAFVERFSDVIDRRLVTPRVRPIGRSVSTLSHWAGRSGRRYWLHLEDDWECRPVDGWLDEAKGLLLAGAAQVRLRRAEERVLDRHMVTREPLLWVERGDHRWSSDAHYTLNPSLVWTSSAEDAWPATGERAAQRRWHRRGMTVSAQHLPGVFAHIGQDRSLREATGCEA